MHFHKNVVRAAYDFSSDAECFMYFWYLAITNVQLNPIAKHMAQKYVRLLDTSCVLR
jgi:hypothetical protein